MVGQKPQRTNKIHVRHSEIHRNKFTCFYLAFLTLNKMFDRLDSIDEFAQSLYGDRQLNQGEVHRILVKAQDLKLISSPNIPVMSPINTKELLEIIKQASKDTRSINNETKATSSESFTKMNLQAANLKVSPSDLNPSNKTANLVKLEKVLDAFLKYEKQRINKKTSKYRTSGILLTIFVISAIIAYICYTPAPY